MRKLAIVLLVGLVCSLGALPTLAQEIQIEVVDGQYIINGQSLATQYTSVEEYEEATGKKIAKFSESPVLRTKVAAGELPPVEERLPEDVAVIIPTEEIGQYGGTLRIVSVEPNGSTDAQYFAGAEHWFTLAPDNKTVIPCLAKGWESSEDGKSITLYLRKGMKWSDGAPFTADDVMFWYEDILLNKELTPTVGSNWSPGGEPVIVEKIDDYTVSFDFAASYPIVKYIFARDIYFLYPKHYLREFHIKYNLKANELAKEEGYEQWYQLFKAKSHQRDGMPLVPGLPSLSSFTCVERTPEYFIFERNPYYWKVDSEGNQLPYVDRIESTYVQGNEMYTAKAVTGQSDFALRATNLQDYTLYKENAEKGKYRVVLWKSATNVSNFYYVLNLVHLDPVLRPIFQDVRFRRALSLAIDREAVNEALFFGMGTPTQATVAPGDRFYEESFIKAYIEYDVEGANQLLDEMGLKWDEKHEYRLRPDGERLSFICEVYSGGKAGPQTEMVTKYWQELGIDVVMKLEGAQLFVANLVGNKMSMYASTGYYTELLLYANGIMFVPAAITMPWIPWARWYNKEEKGAEEPPQWAKQLLEWWEEIKTTLDEERRTELGKKIVAEQAENLWRIGVVGLLPQPLIVSERLRNVPEKYNYGGWDWDHTMPVRPEQFFLTQE